MKVFVTGAGGFLGSHICAYFASQGWEVLGMGRFQSMSAFRTATSDKVKAIEADLPSYKVEDLLRRESPDLVVHCAASASVPYSMQDPYGDLRLSVDLCGFVLDAVRRLAPQSHFIYLSSASVYGQPICVPTSEGEPCQPISPYGYHKWMSELLLKEYGELFGIRCTALRIFSAYGERLQKQVVFDLFRRFIVEQNSVVELFGTGDETRDFIHGLDVAQAIECVFKTGCTGVINVGSGHSTSIRELAEEASRLSGFPGEIRFRGEGRPGDPASWQADIKKLEGIGFVPRVTLAAGLIRVRDWFAKNREVL